MKTILLAALAVALGLFTACSTPEKRIRENPEAFARFTPEQQDLIKQGRVAVGFDPEMVQLAMGDPDRRWTRTDAEGSSEVWTYTTWETIGGQPLYSGFYHRYYSAYSPYYLSYPGRREHEYFKVTFRAGKVVTVEQETR